MYVKVETHTSNKERDGYQKLTNIDGRRLVLAIQVHFRRGRRGCKCGEWSSCSFTQSYVFRPDALAVEIGLVAGTDDGLPEDIGVGSGHGRVLIKIEEELVYLQGFSLVFCREW